MNGTTPVASTEFGLSLSSAGGTAISLTVAASASQVQPSGTVGGPRLSDRALVSSPPVSPHAASPRLQDFGRTPLRFEANQGQTDKQVQFVAHGPGYTVFLTSTEAVLALQPPQSAPATSALASLLGQKTERVDSALSPAGGTAVGGAGTVVRMQLLGGNPAAQASGGQRLPGIVNYFLGNDPSQWHRRIPTYSQVQYQDVYPGVDVVYYGSHQQLEYDFRVAPGADPAQIHLGFAGAQSLSVDATGDLLVESRGQVLRQQAPVVYQDLAGQRRQVAAGFVVQDQQVRFALGGYDRGQPLVIDPTLSYATYFGGSNSDVGADIAVDAAGNVYVVGSTASLDFPTANPLQSAPDDIFVTKLTADGSALVYSTYLGGSRSDRGAGIAVDAAGNAYVTGETGSPDFPTANALQPSCGGFDDAFVTKLTADGSALVYSTYLGGSYYDRNLGDSYDAGVAIAVDTGGNAYVTGATLSTDFPTRNPLQPSLGSGPFGAPDAFVSKLTADGSALVYSTYLGGGSFDDGYGIAVDADGNAYVTGMTGSYDFPTRNPLQPAHGAVFERDAFVSKLTADGSALVYSTYLGGSGGDDVGFGIAVDAAGNAYVAGYTNSPDFPTANPLQSQLQSLAVRNAFVTELTADGSALVYSTYLGGSGDDIGFGSFEE